MRDEAPEPHGGQKQPAAESVPRLHEGSPEDSREALRKGEDYYFEGPYMVFTASYHLKRGACCDSGCRHCPYRAQPLDPASAT